MRAGSPRIVFATALMRAAFSGDLELVKLLLSYGADPKIISKDGETMLSAAAGLGFIQGYSKGKSPAERLEVVKLFVELGADVNQADDYGITPLMVAGNMGDTAIIQYLVDQRRRSGRLRPGQEERRRVRRQRRAADAGRLCDRRRHVRAEQRRHHPRRRREADVQADEGARHHAHDVRVHAARIHLRAGQRRSEGRDAGRDREDARSWRSAIRSKGITGGLEAK